MDRPEVGQVPWQCPKCRRVIWLSSQEYEAHVVAGRCAPCRQEERDRVQDALRWGWVGSLRGVRPDAPGQQRRW